MSDGSSIEWTQATWNPILGCSKVSAGCTNCYAVSVANTRATHPNEQIAAAFAGLTERHANGKLDWTGRINLLPERLDQPLHWRKPRRIFVNSLSDLFHEEVPDSFIDSVFAVMALAPQHTFQVLTKRPKRMSDYFRPIGGTTRGDWVFSSMARRLNVCRLKFPTWPLPNVWLGTSVEDQATANERIPRLLRTPAAIHWVSAEPLLGPIDLHRAIESGPCGYYCDVAVGHVDHGHIDWLVTGGESGTGSRPMRPDWVLSLRDECVAANIPFFYKQWGDWYPSVEFHGEKLEGVAMRRIGKKAAGRVLDGRTWDEYPTSASGGTKH